MSTQYEKVQRVWPWWYCFSFFRFPPVSYWSEYLAFSIISTAHFIRITDTQSNFSDVSVWIDPLPLWPHRLFDLSSNHGSWPSIRVNRGSLIATSFSFAQYSFPASSRTHRKAIDSPPPQPTIARVCTNCLHVLQLTETTHIFSKPQRASRQQCERSTMCLKPRKKGSV